MVHRGGKALHELTVSLISTIALPYDHYGLVTLAVHEASEARILDARVSARFVAGLSRKNGLGACYVRRWLLALTVR